MSSTTKPCASRYRELQRVVHPDRFADGSEQERRLSMQAATQINEAYETLRDPMRGRATCCAATMSTWGPSTRPPGTAAFLMEQMELREELAEVRGSRGSHGGGAGFHGYSHADDQPA